MAELGSLIVSLQDHIAAMRISPPGHLVAEIFNRIFGGLECRRTHSCGPSYSGSPETNSWILYVERNEVSKRHLLAGWNKISYAFIQTDETTGSTYWPS